MDSDSYISLYRVINEVLKIVARIDGDLLDDRSKFDTMLVRMGKIEEQLDRLMGLYSKQTKKVRESVDDAVSGQMESLMDDVQEIKKEVLS